jgi:hypothetical protein
MISKWQSLLWATLLHQVACVSNEPIKLVVMWLSITNTNRNTSLIISSIFSPVGLVLGTKASSQLGNVKKFRLHPSTPVVTRDYGYEVAGYPWFEVESAIGRFKLKLNTEEFSGLNTNFSDGPFPFAVGLSNTYRVETFEVTKSGAFQAYLLQGGQRWQSIRLLTNGSITFSSVGFDASIPPVDVGNLPGTFD